MLGEYTTRATLDIDFVDLGYPAKKSSIFMDIRFKKYKNLKIQCIY